MILVNNVEFALNAVPQSSVWPINHTITQSHSLLLEFMQQALEKTFDVGFQELLICLSFEYKSTFKTYIYKLALIIYLVISISSPINVGLHLI